MRHRHLAVASLLLGAWTLAAYAQTPLAKAFDDFRKNPSKEKTANDLIPRLLVDELPTIEKDSDTLCTALTDHDAYIRQQASAIYGTIALTEPSHNQVVLSCIPGLVTAGSDVVDQVRNNALFALAINPAGPPPRAHHVFVEALKSANFRTIEVGAAGLIKEDGGHNTANHTLVADALAAAPDSKHKVNLLYAISDSNVPSDILFQASQRLLLDPDPNIQLEALNAVAATGTDKAKVVTVMQNLVGSSSASRETKQRAQAVLSRIQAVP